MKNSIRPKSVKCQLPQVFVYTLPECNNQNKMDTQRLTMDTGQLIKEARESVGLKQHQAAKLAGITQQSWSKIERGIIKRPQDLQLIESILGLPGGYLVAHEPNALKLPQSLMARCPLLDWKTAAIWPDKKGGTEGGAEIKSFSSKIIIGADSYILKVEDGSMTSNSSQFSFREGSYLLVDPDKEYASGDFVVAKIKDSSKAFCRRYAKEGTMEYLFANISGIDPIKINSDIYILGVVILNFNILKE